jgi:plasmid stabilization system protein ParE
MSPKLNIRFTKEAGNDLENAANWYEEQRRGLGSMFMLSIESKLAKILRSPEAYPKIDQNTRRALLRKFPYGIYFELVDDHLVVTAVYHSSRDPQNRPNQ